MLVNCDSPQPELSFFDSQFVLFCFSSIEDVSPAISPGFFFCSLVLHVLTLRVFILLSLQLGYSQPSTTDRQGTITN